MPCGAVSFHATDHIRLLWNDYPPKGRIGYPIRWRMPHLAAISWMIHTQNAVQPVVGAVEWPRQMAEADRG